MSEQDKKTPEELWEMWTLFVRRPDLAEDSPFVHSHQYNGSQEIEAALNKWRYWRIGTPVLPSDRDFNDGIRLVQCKS